MNMNDNPEAWEMAKNMYKSIKADDDHFNAGHRRLSALASIGTEWACLTLLLLYLDPSLKDWNNPDKAIKCLSWLISMRRYDLIDCVAEYLIIYGEEEKTKNTGMRLLRIAADANHAPSQYLLSCFLLDEFDEEKYNPEEGVALLKCAAEAGYADAQLSLAHKYFDGDVVPRDRPLAFQWAHCAEDNGNEDALWLLWMEGRDDI